MRVLKAQFLRNPQLDSVQGANGNLGGGSASYAFSAQDEEAAHDASHYALKTADSKQNAGFSVSDLASLLGINFMSICMSCAFPHGCLFEISLGIVFFSTWLSIFHTAVYFPHGCLFSTWLSIFHMAVYIYQ